MIKERYLEIRRSHSFTVKNSYLLIHFAIDLSLLGAAFLLWDVGQGAQFLAIPLLSVLYFRNFSLMHEAVHGAVSTKKWINDFVGVWAGSLAGLPFEPWKKSHLEHHFWSGNHERDPVMALVNILPRWSEPMQNTITFLWQRWIPVLSFMQQGVFWVLSLQNTLKKPNARNIVSLFFPILTLGSVVLLSSWSFLLEVLAPSVLLYLLIVEVVNLPHHLQLPMMKGDSKLPAWDQHLTARTCLYPRLLARFVVLNFNYHVEHHMFPEVPWYYLEQIHAKVRAEPGLKYNTDPSFAWILENRPKALLQVIRTDVTNSTDSARAA